MAIEIVSFPIKNMVISHSYVSLLVGLLGSSKNLPSQIQDLIWRCWQKSWFSVEDIVDGRNPINHQKDDWHPNKIMWCVWRINWCDIYFSCRLTLVYCLLYFFHRHDISIVYSQFYKPMRLMIWRCPQSWGFGDPPGRCLGRVAGSQPVPCLSGWWPW